MEREGEGGDFNGDHLRVLASKTYMGGFGAIKITKSKFPSDFE